MKLHHETLNSGHITTTDLRRGTEYMMPIALNWLKELLASGKRHHLPFPPEAYQASAKEKKGGLLMTVYDPVGYKVLHFGCGEGVKADELWRCLHKDFNLRKNGEMDVEEESIPIPAAPEIPWCLVYYKEPVAAFSTNTMCIADFQRRMAFAWARKFVAICAE